mmetsp:Transcript_7094/g.15574  ORF Transcript_7094/g.15574 Transcript_7094/m.15574 type:complete len:265 (+) Transcript_7094:875-1669(+)
MPEKGSSCNREFSNTPRHLSNADRQNSTLIICHILDIHLAEVSKVVRADKQVSSLLHAIETFPVQGEVVLVRSILAAESGIEAFWSPSARQDADIRRQNTIEHGGVVIVVRSKGTVLLGLQPQIQCNVVASRMHALVRSSASGVIASDSVLDKMALYQGFEQLGLDGWAVWACCRILPSEAMILCSNVSDLQDEVAESGLAPIELATILPLLGPLLFLVRCCHRRPRGCCRCCRCCWRFQWQGFGGHRDRDAVAWISFCLTGLG